MISLKKILVISMIIAYARSMPQPKSKTLVEKSNKPSVSINSNEVSPVSMFSEEIPSPRVRHSAFPIGGSYDSSHRSAPSWYDGSPRTAPARAPQRFTTSRYNGSHRSAPYPMRSYSGSHRSAPSRYTRSPNASPLRYNGSHRSAPSWRAGFPRLPNTAISRGLQRSATYRYDGTHRSALTRSKRSSNSSPSRYNGSHRSAPSWRAGFPRLPNTAISRGLQRSVTSRYDVTHRSALSRSKRSPNASPSRYNGSHRSAPSRYDGSHQSAPIYWGARGRLNKGSQGSGVIVYG